MKRKQNIIPPRSEQPFRVPEGYFDSLEERIMKSIHSDEKKFEEYIGTKTDSDEQKKPREIKKEKISLRPYFALAAAITGIALVTYLILQTASESLIGENQPEYDIETLYNAGVFQDESVLAESYAEMEEDGYSEWDEDAMTYLASSELELLLLIEESYETY